MSEEEFRKIAKEYAEMYFTKGIDITKIFKYVDELEKKVEQLEKENKELKYLVDDSNIMKAFIVEHSKVEQLENIRKEAIEYITTEQLYTIYQWGKSQYVKILKDLLNILNKGDNNGK